MIRINENLSIPEREIWFEFAHSGGPGGQNVNKVATQATLCWAPAVSGALDERQKRIVFSRLANRMTQDGILRIIARESRQQLRNREIAKARLVELLAEALKPRKRRLRTKPTRGSQERRIKEKRVRSETKRQRGRIDNWE